MSLMHAKMFRDSIEYCIHVVEPLIIVLVLVTIHTLRTKKVCKVQYLNQKTIETGHGQSTVD